MEWSYATPNICLGLQQGARVCLKEVAVPRLQDTTSHACPGPQPSRPPSSLLVASMVCNSASGNGAKMAPLLPRLASRFALPARVVRGKFFTYALTFRIQLLAPSFYNLCQFGTSFHADLQALRDC